MEQRTYNVYKFKELPEDVQEKVLSNYYQINVDHRWWEFIFEDAKNIGLKITDFDLDRGAYCKGEWLVSPYEAIKLIKKEHGKTSETYKTAVSYEKQFKTLGKDEAIEDDFRNSLLEDYGIILQKEYNYLTSKEAIIETIECNDYDFTLEGKID